jgi:hypothetical protein
LLGMTASQNAPLGTQYQPLTTEPPSDNGPTNIQAMSLNAGASADANLVDNPLSTESELPRRCSVRGCVSIIPADSTNKMCETCRGRHRIYAMTKRAKRKMEKEALTQGVALLSNDQPPGTIWLPENPEFDDEQPEPINESIPGVAGETNQLPVQSPEVCSAVATYIDSRFRFRMVAGLSGIRFNADFVRCTSANPLGSQCS